MSLAFGASTFGDPRHKAEDKKAGVRSKVGLRMQVEPHLHVRGRLISIEPPFRLLEHRLDSLGYSSSCSMQHLKIFLPKLPARCDFPANENLTRGEFDEAPSWAMLQNMLETPLSG